MNKHITTYCSDSDNRDKKEKKCSTSKKKCSDDKLENLRSISHSLFPYTKDWDRESHTANKEDTCFPLNNDITKCKDQLLDIYSDVNSNVLKKLTKMFLTVRPINIVTDVDKGRFIEVLFAVSKDDERLKNSSKIFKQIIDNDEINYVEPLCEEEPNCIYHNFTRQGYSVKELSETILTVKKFFRYVKLDSKAVDYLGLDDRYILESRFLEMNNDFKINLIYNIFLSIRANFDLLAKYLEIEKVNITVKMLYDIVLIILLDLKKSGDWGMVNYCKRTNSILVTVDQLCALYALVNNTRVIFTVNLDNNSKYLNLVIFNPEKKCVPKTGTDILRYVETLQNQKIKQ